MVQSKVHRPCNWINNPPILRPPKVNRSLSYKRPQYHLTMISQELALLGTGPLLASRK